jgi:ribokinase
MNRPYDVLTVLDVCVDFLAIGCPEPRFGQAEQLIDGYEIEMGGSAAIFASQCAKLGLNTLGVGRAGEDVFGRLFLEKLAATGVNTSAVIADKNARTGVGIALCRQNDRAILTYTGTIDGTNADMVLERFSGARHLHIASYYLMASLKPHWPYIVRQAKACGLTVSLDTNWDPEERWDGLDGLEGFVDILLPNEMEARAFTGKEDSREALLELSRRFPVVAMKLGPQGAMACQDGILYDAPGLPVSVVDTVGAGDTFDAGFLYGWLSGLPLQRCLQIGCFCGARSVTARGGIAAQPNKSDVEELLSEI